MWSHLNTRCTSHITYYTMSSAKWNNCVSRAMWRNFQTIRLSLFRAFVMYPYDTESDSCYCHKIINPLKWFHCIIITPRTVDVVVFPNVFNSNVWLACNTEEKYLFNEANVCLCLCVQVKQLNAMNLHEFRRHKRVSYDRNPKCTGTNETRKISNRTKIERDCRVTPPTPPNLFVPSSHTLACNIVIVHRLHTRPEYRLNIY